MKCLFCGSDLIGDSFLPSTLFNGKRFDYKCCKNCQLHFISPLPNEEDLLKMYPPEYQSGVDKSIMKDPYQKLIGLRSSYGFQFDLLKKIDFKGKMLDFGCGNAHFLINAKHAGFDCDGLEYNPKHVAILKQEIPDQDFFAYADFFESDVKYDLIRLSNVFEHFTDPKSSINLIKKKLKPGGFLLVEGPIETNFNWALVYRKLYFKVRKALNKKYLASHTPTHIIFSNLKNQIHFFEVAGFEERFVKVSEAEWPFPKNLKAAKGTIQKVNVIIARMSMMLKKLNPRWGNTFIYLGQVN